MGRPTLFTPELVSEICERLSKGETLRSVCRSDHMPEHSTIFDWIKSDYRGFSDQYARAREAGYASMADELLEIADDRTEDPNRTKHRLDTRKWLMSKALPKVYGDKLMHAGADGENFTIVLREDIARD